MESAGVGPPFHPPCFRPSLSAAFPARHAKASPTQVQSVTLGFLGMWVSLSWEHEVLEAPTPPLKSPRPARRQSWSRCLCRAVKDGVGEQCSIEDMDDGALCAPPGFGDGFPGWGDV